MKLIYDIFSYPPFSQAQEVISSQKMDSSIKMN